MKEWKGTHGEEGGGHTLERQGEETTQIVGMGPAFAEKLGLTVYWETMINMMESLDGINQSNRNPNLFCQQESVS